MDHCTSHLFVYKRLQWCISVPGWREWSIAEVSSSSATGLRTISFTAIRLKGSTFNRMRYVRQYEHHRYFMDVEIEVYQSVPECNSGAEDGSQMRHQCRARYLSAAEQLAPWLSVSWEHFKQILE